MAKRSLKNLPLGFLNRIRRERETILREELPELLAKGKAIFDRHERPLRTIKTLKAE